MDVLPAPFKTTEDEGEGGAKISNNQGLLLHRTGTAIFQSLLAKANDHMLFNINNCTILQGFLLIRYFLMILSILFVQFYQKLVLYICLCSKIIIPYAYDGYYGIGYMKENDLFIVQIIIIKLLFIHHNSYKT